MDVEAEVAGLVTKASYNSLYNYESYKERRRIVSSKRKVKELRGTVTQQKQRTAVQKLSFVGSSSDCVTRRKEDDRSKDGDEVMLWPRSVESLIS